MESNRVEIKCEGAATLPLSAISILQGELKSLSKENYAKLKKQILEHGFSAPFFIWKNSGKNYVIDGTQRHRTLLQMQKEGISLPAEFPVVWIEAKDEKEARKKLLAFVSQYGHVEPEGLYQFMHDSGITIEDVKISFDLPNINLDKFETGYFKDEVKGNIGDDEIPEVKETRCKTGQLWRLGDHKLLCGDCTDPKNVERLMGGEKADMVFTDPPYGLGKKKNFNDTFKDYADDGTFDLKTIDLLPEYVIWGGNYYDWLPLPRTEIGWIVWDKRPDTENMKADPSIRDSADRIFGQHFEIAISNISECRGKMIRRTWGGYYGLKIDRSSNSDSELVHKTQKPTDLFIACVQNRHKLVVDYFLGSGSTLIACEKTGRRCFGMEIDEHYCSVILARFEQFTGKRAELIN